MRPQTTWLLTIGLLAAVNLLDFVTGPHLWCGPFYLLVVCLASWTLGWKAGHCVGIVCLALGFLANGMSLYPYGDRNLLWNVASRFAAISIVSAAIAGMRGAYIREWWLARTDTLTGALNRQAFFELAAQAIHPSQCRLLLYADIDGLKKINDSHGHAAGDASLRAYGEAVKAMLRDTDIVARVGGDEFVIFMNVSDEVAAKMTAEHLHTTMNGVGSDHGTLSCSVGALVVPPCATSLGDLVKSADGLMYEAKLRGAGLQLGTITDASL